MLPLDHDIVRLAVSFACWGEFVHYELTKRWALEEGYSQRDAEEVARWNLLTDRLLPGNRRRSKRYHFLRHGAEVCGEFFLARALREHELGYLGMALHCAQDAIGHGRLGHLFHLPPIDRWGNRSESVRRRTEHESKRLLRAFRLGEKSSKRRR